MSQSAGRTTSSRWFCGRFFIEKCLTVGGGNSPTIYHLPASLLKMMAEVESDFDSRQAIMQLEDKSVADRKGSVRLWCYRSSYRARAVEMVVRTILARLSHLRMQEKS